MNVLTSSLVNFAIKALATTLHALTVESAMSSETSEFALALQVILEITAKKAFVKTSNAKTAVFVQSKTANSNAIVDQVSQDSNAP